MEERPIEHYEGKVLAAADKWLDAKNGRVGKSGDALEVARARYRGSEHALACAICDLRVKRSKPP
jgi:hypothetical protein